MNFIINLFNLINYNVIIIIINTLLIKHYYISCIVNDKKIIVKVIVNLLIKEIFKLYKLLSFIIFNREF